MTCRISWNSNAYYLYIRFCNIPNRYVKYLLIRYVDLSFHSQKFLVESRIGWTTVFTNLSVCSLARPIYFFGSMDLCRSSRERLNAGSAAISSSRLLSLPSTLTVFPASWKAHGYAHEVLTVTACFYSIHHDILCSHERKLCHHMFLDNLRINNQSIYNIKTEVKDFVNSKETFRNTRALLICRVIQSSQTTELQMIAGLRASTITYLEREAIRSLLHRISLIRHCGGADLRFSQMVLLLPSDAEEGGYHWTSCVHLLQFLQEHITRVSTLRE